MTFDRIPNELKAYPQWVCWCYVQRDDGKWTKQPYSPRTVTIASVTDATTWATFDEAVAGSSVNGMSGIGFVLTRHDPFTFTDLDDPYAVNPDGTPKFSNPDELMQRQRQVFEAMPTYAELSPSGKGLHLISIGAVEKGKRRGSMELYSSERYMTMTGNVYRDMPITNQQASIDWLYNNLGGAQAHVTPQSMLFVDDPAPDDVILKHAFSAANGKKVEQLYRGEYQDAGYPSQSEADWALIDNLQFYTRSRQQIRRLFMASGLGQRDKSKRPGYVESMIDRSFDRMPAEVDLEALSAALDAERDRLQADRDARAKHAFSPMVPPQQSMLFSAPDAPAINDPELEQSPYLALMPGLMGAIASYIYRAAPRPVPEIAVAGAIGLMAGIVGRAYNVNSTGLNVYILLLAKTGRGKEAIATGVQRLMAPVRQSDGGGGVPGADEFLGPQEIASGQALIKYLAKTSRSFVSIISEFDGFMSTLTQRNIPPAVAKLKQVLLYSYTRSGHGQRIDKSIYSEAEKNVPVIPSPAITLVGEGTPDKFYELLSDDLIADGFLPRFSVIEYEGPRTDANPNFAQVVPEPELVSAMARLSAHCLSLNSKDEVLNVGVTPEAKAMLDAFDRECDALINSSAGPIIQLWNRAHLKALKLAALLAVGVNMYAPTIDAAHAHWAIACARHDTRKLALRFSDGKVGAQSLEGQQVVLAKSKLRRLFSGKLSGMSYKLSGEALAAGVFNSMYLQGATSNLMPFKNDRRGATQAYHAMLNNLKILGVIDELGRADKEKLNVLGTAYVIRDWAWLNRDD